MILNPPSSQGAVLSEAPWLGLDIGGANLKIADGRGFALCRPFPLWRSPERLAAAVGEMLAAAPHSGRLAVTMTGELADCYESKQAGVEHILHSVRSAAAGREVWVYLVDGRLAALDEALAAPRLAAASNWHALACFAAWRVEGAGLLIDIGSTTTDIIPLADGRPATRAQTDLERLLAYQLLYTGATRSPVCAVLHQAPYRGSWRHVAQELFATMRDVALVLEEAPEAPSDHDTADGRPATRQAAVARLGRMFCADAEEFHLDDAIALACAAREAQLAAMEQAVRQVMRQLPRPLEAVVVSGSGKYLAHRLADRVAPQGRRISLAAEIGGPASTCAAAHALAALANRRPTPAASSS